MKCVCKIERERMCLRKKDIELEQEGGCIYHWHTCVCEREKVCVCVCVSKPAHESVRDVKKSIAWNGPRGHDFQN